MTGSLGSSLFYNKNDENEKLEQMSGQTGADIFEFESFASLLADLSFFMFFMNSRTRFKFDYDMRLVIYATFAGFSVTV